MPSSNEDAHDPKFLKVPIIGYVNTFKDFFKKKKKVYVCLFAEVVCITCMLGPSEARGVQKRASDSLEGELEAAMSLPMWVLGTSCTLPIESSLQSLKYVNSISTFALKHKQNKTFPNYKVLDLDF